jgi:uncharacterized protein DUF695/regulator of ribonuclease activity B
MARQPDKVDLMSDDWDSYLLRVDDQPASIFVDLGIRTHAPVKSHTTMAYLRLRMRRPRQDGLSSQDEFDDLIAVERRVSAKIIEDGTAIFVGRNTSGGNRDFYFYVTDPAKFANAALMAMREFPAYAYETGAQEDREWRTYFDFLHPSAIDLRRILNRRICEQLKEHGDNADNGRKIDHLALLPNSAAQSALARHIQAEGFNIENIAREPNVRGQFSVAFSRVDRLTRIDEIVLPLFQKTAELGGIYDGWGCRATP